MTASYKIHEAPFDADYYLSQTKLEYYTKGGEPPGRWFGEAARALSLPANGVVVGKDLKRVLDNTHPGTGRPLARTKVKASKSPYRSPARTYKGKPLPEPMKMPVAAYEICFSWKKVDSLAYILNELDIQRVMDAAAHRALDTVLSWLESNVPLTRRGRGGRQKEFAKLVAAIFDHSTNRNNQIQKHHHVVIANVCQREYGSWARIDSSVLREYVRMLGPLWQTEFAHELRESLGIQHVKVTDTATTPSDYEQAPAAPHYTIRGIPEALIEASSSRRAEILADLVGDLDLGENVSAQARLKAALKTRGAKPPVPSPSELSQKCIAEAAKFGFTPADAKALLWQSTPVDVDQAYNAAKERALARITYGQSHFTKRQLVTAIAEEIQEAGIRAEDLLDRVAYDLYHSPELMPLAERKGEMRFTTRAMWELEERLLDHVRALRDRPGSLASAESIAIALADNRELTLEQEHSVKHVLSHEGALQLLTGVAGSGKSRTAKTIHQAVERDGRVSLGLAVAGAAAEELAAKTGFPCRTVASFLFQLENQDKLGCNNAPLIHARSVVFVDEIGMLDTASMVRVLEHVRKANAMLIGLGDSKQLPPILAGSPLERMKKEVDGVHLVKNQRQMSRADQLAAIHIRRGNAEKAIAQYSECDKLIVASNKSEAVRQLVASWVKAGAIERPQDHIIFVEQRREARVINQLCQAERHRAAIDPLKAVTFDDQKLTRGDRIIFHRNVRDLHIKNGYRGTIIHVSRIRHRITVRLDHERRPVNVKCPLSPIVTVPLRDLRRGALTLAYACTTHKLQGQSVPHAYALTGSRSNKEMSYTQLTRGSVDTRIFVSQDEAGEGLKDLSKAMKKSIAKDLAHDVVDEADRRGKEPPRPQTRQKPSPPRPWIHLHPVSEKQGSGLGGEPETKTETYKATARPWIKLRPAGERQEANSGTAAAKHPLTADTPERPWIKLRSVGQQEVPTVGTSPEKQPLIPKVPPLPWIKLRSEGQQHDSNVVGASEKQPLASEVTRRPWIKLRPEGERPNSPVGHVPEKASGPSISGESTTTDADKPKRERELTKEAELLANRRTSRREPTIELRPEIRHEG